MLANVAIRDCMSLEDSASFIAAICSNDASYRPLEPELAGVAAAASHREYLGRTSVQLQIIWINFIHII